MPDNLSPEQRKKAMRAVKSKGTRLEASVTGELWRRGLRFRKNVKTLYGNPDIAVKKYKAVIFIDSCFWHGCNLHCRLPQKNREFWSKKIERNKRRDAEVTSDYSSKGWNILRVWEHDLKADFGESIETMELFLAKVRSDSSGITFERRECR